jgi:peptidyl-prolyl cis-trans isomerase D
VRIANRATSLASEAPAPYILPPFHNSGAVLRMISLFRRFVDSWAARGFFILMALAFVGWGVSGDRLRMISGSPTWIAKVGSETIEAPAFQANFQRALAQQTQNLPSGQEAPPALRQQVGQQLLSQMVSQAALAAVAKQQRIVAPDAAVASVIRSMPTFKGSDGQFNRQAYETALRNAGYTEDRFVSELRADIIQRQILTALTSSVTAPDAEVTPLYTNEFEKRAADTASFPLSAAPAPPVPTEAQLQRWYDNHPDSYTTPEYRRIKAIILAPQTLAADVKISDEDLHAAYNEHRSEFEKPATRSAEVISAPDEAKAKTLAAQWSGGADWAAMQKATEAAGASAISQDDATAVQFPDPDLAKAVFAAPANTVSPPIKGALGWFVVKVTKITPGVTTTFEQAKDKLQAQLLAGKAADLMYDRANKIDQLLGNGGNLDALPNDLGLAGVEGTMDAAGNTQQGTPAPIPGSTELKDAIVKAAFQAHQGDQPQLTEVQTPSTGGSAYYALTVEAIVPPGKKSFDAVKQQVSDDWQQDQRHRAQDAKATAMMLAVQKGQSFSDAATVAGVTPQITTPVTRNEQTTAVPPELQRVLFGLKKNEATMVQTQDGFIVAQLVEITKPDPTKDKAGFDAARTAVQRSISDDTTTTYINAIRLRANPQINQQAFNSVVQP